MDLGTLKQIRKDSLRVIIDIYKRADAGHIGASLSCLDILVYLYFEFMNSDDRFILSKGHAALGLYVVNAKKGLIDDALLNTFYNNGTLLAAHPPCNKGIPSIPFGTGSLGHGLSLATGFAFSNCFTKKTNRVFCILSDGDCDEGSTWEAALFASQHKLNNLFVIIDNNKLQGFGKSVDVINLEPLSDKWKSFNFDVVIAERGNDFESLNSSFKEVDNMSTNNPKCIIAKTVKGNGISFMENKLEWHYLPLTDELYSTAISEIEKI
jgi:transketolase